MDDNNIRVLRPGNETARLNDRHNDEFDTSYHYVSGGGGGDDMQARVAKIESHIEYIRRDIEELKTDVKSIDGRLTTIETGISSLKTTFKATGIVVSVVFAFCVYVFGSYVSKILEALNGLVFK
ncbi:hemolysin XhlA [Yersinia enterocolitica]|uniref:hemolysin XhlA n=1 Tax=Yersinia enterocolitica TaxID=630 RepID=UPI00286089A2|nr:hemolysin XhlA [Yersinia enterocolitica]HDV5951135.1 hemolysin XhlA [Yersinia enterocolitica]HDV7149519.1 hemolysin XhlA [Yersinia enterocolitica]HED5568831.1 hemolysin XhlA [Yersinia enterocolitica]